VSASSESRPVVSFSTLAKAMHGMSPVALTELLRGHKQRSMGPRRSYQAARRQAIDFLSEGVPFNVDAPLRSHEREAVRALVACPPRLPRWVRGCRANRREPWIVDGVRISMTPDLELDGRLEGGVAKFSFTKKPLPTGVGNTMATLMWLHERISRRSAAKKLHCIVFEPRARRLYLPIAKPERALRSLKITCAMICALWPLI